MSEVLAITTTNFGYLKDYLNRVRASVVKFLTWKKLLALGGSTLLLLLLRRWWINREVANLRARAVLITGCDSGFGRATALQLVKKHQVKVFAGCLTESGLKSLETECASPLRLTPFLLDVTNEESVKNAFTLVRDNLKGQGLWALINNAGVLRSGILECCPISDWELQYQVNVIGIARTSKRFLPLIRKAKGRIINIASVAGRLATPGVSSYNASKFAVEGLSDAWRRELARWGVKVIIIEPGIMKTNLWDNPLSPAIINSWLEELDVSEKSLYSEEYFTKEHRKGIKLVSKVGGDPQQVVDVLVNCVRLKSVKSRYNVGLDSHIFLFLASLPTCISDWLVSKLMKADIPPGLAKS